MNPLVTVAIPTRDRPDSLRRAVCSALRQTVTAIEVVIVDDGSTPAVDIADAAQGDRRVRLLRNEAAAGVSASRNMAIADATGSWVAFLDDDDLWHPHKLETQLTAANHAQADFVWTGALLVDEQARTLATMPAPQIVDLPRQLLGENAIGSPSSVLVRREILMGAGGFDARLSILADWDLWLTLSHHATGCAVPEFLTAIVQHSSSMQVVQVEETARELELMRDKHADLMGAVGAPLGNARSAMWFAAKEWLAHPTVATGLKYLRQSLRYHGVLGVTRAAVARGKGRDPAPPWIRDGLHDGEPYVPASSA